jgi:hypothetical protein
MEAQPELVRLGHADELNARFPVLRPPHDTQIDTHRPLTIEMHPKLDALAWL